MRVGCVLAELGSPGRSSVALVLVDLAWLGRGWESGLLRWQQAAAGPGEAGGPPSWKARTGISMAWGEGSGVSL